MGTQSYPGEEQAQSQPVIAGQLNEIKRQQREIHDLVDSIKGVTDRISNYPGTTGGDVKNLSPEAPGDPTVTSSLSDILDSNSVLGAKLSTIYEHLSRLI